MTELPPGPPEMPPGGEAGTTPPGGDAAAAPPGGGPPPSPGAFSLVFDGFSRAWDRMVEILFRGPHANVRGWLAWGLVIVLAGALGGGVFQGNFRLPGKEWSRSFHGRDLLDLPDFSSLRDAFSPLGPGEIVLVGLAAILVVALVLFALWLSSVFRYVFLEDVDEGRPAIREPFRRNVARSRGYFLFRLAVAILALAVVAVFLVLFGGTVLGLLAGGGEGAAVAGVAGMLLFFFLAVMPFFLLLGVVRWFALDIVLPVHLRRGGGFGEAFRESLRLAAREPLGLLLLAVGRLVVGILGTVAMLAAVCVTCCLWLPPTVILAAILVLPTIAFWPLAVVTVPLLLAATFALKWLFASLLSPYPVLVRAWSIAFVDGLLGTGPAPAEPSSTDGSP